MSSIAQRLMKGSTWRSLNYFSQVVVSLFMTPFVVFSLGDRLYGFWTLVAAMIGYYGLLDLGLSQAVTRFISGAIGTEDYDECNRVFNTSFVLFMMFGVIALAVSIGLASASHMFVDNHDDASLFAIVILILGINMAFELPLRAFYGILSSQLRFDIMSILQVATLFIRTILTIIVLVLGYKLLAIALVTVLAAVPQKALTIYYARKNLPHLRLSRRDLSRDTFRKLFSYSIFVFIANLADVLRFNVDFLVIGAFVGLAGVTHYKIGSMLANHFLIFMVTFIGVCQPVFSRLYGAADHESIKRTFILVNKISIIVSSFIGFALISWGKPFIVRWMGSEYIDAYPVLLILVVGIILALWQAPSFDLLLGTSGHRFVGIINTIEGAGNLGLSLVLVKYYGLIGVALGTAIPMAAVKLIVQPLYVAKTLRIPYLEFIQTIGKTVILVCLMLILPAAISFFLAAPNYLALVAVGVLSFCIYAALVWFRLLSPIETKMLREAVSRSA